MKGCLSLSVLTVSILSIQGWLIFLQHMKLKDDDLNSQIYKFEQGPLETIQSNSHLVDFNRELVLKETIAEERGKRAG